MSSFGSQMRKRMAELRKAGENVPKIMAEVAEGATIEAVRVATEKTPPNDGTLAGTNMRSGQMAQHWATDSVTTPVVTSESVVTELNNHMQYASYVNDGHRVDAKIPPALMGLLQDMRKEPEWVKIQKPQEQPALGSESMIEKKTPPPERTQRLIDELLHRT